MQVDLKTAGGTEVGEEPIYISVHTGINPRCDNTWPEYGAPLCGFSTFAKWGESAEDPLGQLMTLGFKLNDSVFAINVAVADDNPQAAAVIAVAGLVRFVIQNATRLQGMSNGRL